MLTDAELPDYIERTPGLKAPLIGAGLYSEDLFTERHFSTTERANARENGKRIARTFHAHEQRIRSECVPPGYRLVPEELFRQLKHYTESHRLCFPDCGAPTEEEVTAMLSAAPAAPTEQNSGDVG